MQHENNTTNRKVVFVFVYLRLRHYNSLKWQNCFFSKRNITGNFNIRHTRARRWLWTPQ